MSQGTDTITLQLNLQEIWGAFGIRLELFMGHLRVTLGSGLSCWEIDLINRARYQEITQILE